MYVNCVVTEHLAECKRFKSFLKCKVVKSKNQKFTKFIFGFTFLYLPNVFIHVRMVNKLPTFKFTVQRLSDLVLTYSVGKDDFQIILPSGWNLLSVTLWCLHPGHCYSSTHLLYNFVHHTHFNQFGREHFFVRAKRALKRPDLAVPYRAPVYLG